MEKPMLCAHCNKENITFNIAGNQVHIDQCIKCYDNSVSNFILKVHYFK